MSSSPPPTNMLNNDAITTIDRRIETESNDNLTADTVPRKKRKGLLEDSHLAERVRTSNMLYMRKHRANKNYKQIIETENRKLRQTKELNDRLDNNMKLISETMEELITFSNKERIKNISERFKWSTSYTKEWPITMQIKTADNEWIDWVEVRVSNIEDAGFGLFACVDMPKDTIISIYIGNEKKSADENRDYVFNTSFHFNKGGKWVQGKKKKDGSRGTILDAIPDDSKVWKKGLDLFLGAHMINDPNFMKKNVTEKLIPSNARLHIKCEILACQFINAGDEILVNYQEEIVTKRARRNTLNRTEKEKIFGKQVNRCDISLNDDDVDRSFISTQDEPNSYPKLIAINNAAKEIQVQVTVMENNHTITVENSEPENDLDIEIVGKQNSASTGPTMTVTSKRSSEASKPIRMTKCSYHRCPGYSADSKKCSQCEIGYLHHCCHTDFMTTQQHMPSFNTLPKEEKCYDCISDESDKILKKIVENDLSSAIAEDEEVDNFYRNLDKIPFAYSMIIGGPDGCDLMMITNSHWHKENMTWAHLRKFFRIKIADGMVIIFVDHNYHAGATTDNNLKNARLFGYLSEADDKIKMGKGGTPSPQGNRVRSQNIKSCDNTETGCDGTCSLMKSKKIDDITLDFRGYNLENYDEGDILGGDIKKHGWIDNKNQN